MVVAHRGASKAAPENTLEAFALAASMGAAMVELDVRRASDGELVIHHNPFDVRPPGAPTLLQALDLCGALGMEVNIEIKNSPRDPDFDPSDSIAIEVAALLVTAVGAPGVVNERTPLNDVPTAFEAIGQK